MDLLKQITEAYQADMEGSNKPRPRGKLPVSFETMTTQWLTSVLVPPGQDVRVTSFRLGEPDNGTYNRRRVHLSYSGSAPTLPKSVFCKATHDLPNRLIMGASGSARAEVAFYNEIRPVVDIEAPCALFARFDPDSFNSMIMLEDLGAVEFCKHTSLIDHERAESQLRLLAQFHGRFAQAADLAWATGLFVSFQTKFNRFAQMEMEQCCGNGVLAAEQVFPRVLFSRRDEIWPATVSAVRAADHLPPTLNHGDVHLANWYMTGAGRMGLTDWSAVCTNHWSRDLAYVISTSLTVDDRRSWEAGLVRFYLDELHRAGGPRADFVWAFEQYRRQLPSALAYWTITLAPGPQMPVFQPEDLTLEFVRRIATAMADLDSLDVRAR